MAHGFIIENELMARDVDSLNKYAVSAIAVDGGCPVALTAPTGRNSVWTATASADGKGVAIAYNPEEKYIAVEGKVFAGAKLSSDVRDFTNVAGRTFDVFLPQKGDRMTISAKCVDGTTTLEAGNILETKADNAIWAKVNSHTAGKTALVIDAVINKQFPNAGIGAPATELMYVCHVLEA